jgi:hypothetical protein
MVNCLADQDLDAVYKPHLSEAVLVWVCGSLLSKFGQVHYSLALSIHLVDNESLDILGNGSDWSSAGCGVFGETCPTQGQASLKSFACGSSSLLAQCCLWRF